MPRKRAKAHQEDGGLCAGVRPPGSLPPTCRSHGEHEAPSGTQHIPCSPARPLAAADSGTGPPGAPGWPRTVPITIKGGHMEVLTKTAVTLSNNAGDDGDRIGGMGRHPFQAKARAAETDQRGQS